MRRGTDAKGRGPGVRITFLINWWNEKPLGPNCNAVEAKMIKELGVLFSRNRARAPRAWLLEADAQQNSLWKLKS
eukprot:3087616-Rhodomonas_salina.1